MVLMSGNQSSSSSSRNSNNHNGSGQISQQRTQGSSRQDTTSSYVPYTSEYKELQEQTMFGSSLYGNSIQTNTPAMMQETLVDEDQHDVKIHPMEGTFSRPDHMINSEYDACHLRPHMSNNHHNHFGRASMPSGSSLRFRFMYTHQNEATSWGSSSSRSNYTPQRYLVMMDPHQATSSSGTNNRKQVYEEGWRRRHHQQMNVFSRGHQDPNLKSYSSPSTRPNMLITNPYHSMFAAYGMPVDPHLRLYMEKTGKWKGKGKKSANQ